MKLGHVQVNVLGISILMYVSVGVIESHHSGYFMHSLI